MHNNKINSKSPQLWTFWRWKWLLTITRTFRIRNSELKQKYININETIKITLTGIHTSFPLDLVVGMMFFSGESPLQQFDVGNAIPCIYIFQICIIWRFELPGTACPWWVNQLQKTWRQQSFLGEYLTKFSFEIGFIVKLKKCTYI